MRGSSVFHPRKCVLLFHSSCAILQPRSGARGLQSLCPDTVGAGFLDDRPDGREVSLICYIRLCLTGVNKSSTA